MRIINRILCNLRTRKSEEMKGGQYFVKNPYAICALVGKKSHHVLVSLLSAIAAPAVHRQISIRICHNALR